MTLPTARCVLVFACALAALVPGCGGAAARGNAAAPRSPAGPVAPPKPKVIELEPMRIQVVTGEGGEQSVIATDARDLFDRGNQALVGGNPDEALRLYTELLTEFADSKLVPATLYNAGLALEAKGDLDGAVQRYRELARRKDAGRDAIDGLIRAAAVMADAERWPDSLAVIDAVLARTDLTESDRLEGLSRKGYVQIEAKDYAAAEATLNAAVAHYEKLVGNYHFESDYFIAMAYFYLGEIPRRQFVAIPIRLPESQMERDLEAKASLVLLAKERYDKALAVGNVYWATASGYRLGSMQRDFWESIVTAPIPSQLSAREAKIYVDEVHKVALRHLEQALSVHTRTVELADLYQTSTQWSDASKQEATELVPLIAKEKRGELTTPARRDAPPADGAGISAATYVPSPVSL